MNARAEWQKAVSAATFPVGMRPVKATLLSLPLDPQGQMTAWRDEIATRTGLPLRTIDRHLSRAVAAGWLRHEKHGGHGRRGTYTASIPEEVARQQWRTTGGSCAPRSTRNSEEVARHVVANSREDTASVSEHLAVDELRQRRNNHDGSRAERNHRQTQRRIDEQAPRHSAIDAVWQLRAGSRCVCGGLRQVS